MVVPAAAVCKHKPNQQPHSFQKWEGQVYRGPGTSVCESVFWERAANGKRLSLR